MSDVMNIIGSMDVVEHIAFTDKEVLDLFYQGLTERTHGHCLSYIKGPVEITLTGELTAEIKGKIIDVAPAYVMSVMMQHPSSLAIESAAKYVKDKYGFETKNVEGDICPTITLTDDVIAGLMRHYPEIAEKVRSLAESKVNFMGGRKFLNRGRLAPLGSKLVNLEQSGITVELSSPSDLDSFALTLAGNRPVWQPNKLISEGFAFAGGISDETWEHLTKSPACVTMVGTDTVMVTGKAIDVCNTMMSCMLSSGALRANIDNVGNHLAEKYGFRYPVDGVAPWMVRTTVRQGKAYSAQPQKVTPFTSPLQPVQAKWEEGFVGESAPKEVEEKYDRAVEIYNELNSARLPGPERAALLAEMQSITNSGVLLYALKRHHYDVE